MIAHVLAVVLRLRWQDASDGSQHIIKLLCGKGVNILRTESRDYIHPSCERSRRTTSIHPANGVAGLQTSILRTESQDYIHPSCERSRRTTNIRTKKPRPRSDLGDENVVCRTSADLRLLLNFVGQHKLGKGDIAALAAWGQQGLVSTIID